jgi:ribosome-associated protein
VEVLLKDMKESAAAVARLCARVLDRSKMENVRIVDVGNALQITDYFVIASGRNARHVKAASDDLLKELRSGGRQRRGREGYKDGRWVLLDLGDVIVHLFLGESREFYDLEHLWGECPVLEWREAGAPSAQAAVSRL